MRRGQRRPSKDDMHRRRNLSLLGSGVFIATMTFGTTAQAEVLFSDDLEGHAPWDGCPDDSFSEHLQDWSGYFGTWTCGIFEIENTDGNNTFKFNWPQSISSLGPAVPRELTAGRGSVYLGFRWRHDAGWDWGTDNTHKWVYLPTANGERTMLSIVYGSIAFFDGYDYHMHATSDPDADSEEWLDDTGWHDVVVFAAPDASTIRVWYDGEELTWAENNVGGASFGGPAFDDDAGSNIVFGYQSRTDWGPGNTTYFDDLIVATTKAEVDAFLGLDDPSETGESGSGTSGGGESGGGTEGGATDGDDPSAGGSTAGSGSDPSASAGGTCGSLGQDGSCGDEGGATSAGEGNDTASGASDSGSGCSVRASPTAPPFRLLGLGLLGLVVRRRRTG